ncbi:putative aflatoxin biosynthesis ketoreductase nor-1 [Dendryphion nanum]|uniref:Aflatoxin biosynthesis ketoreductase nor-1 n=1 Tax=Dendryphion nanum TaxID=256645 RepID=A0A9P9D9R3_9PLEO|nr:putative aflatoxin biosynthesis ketoreductase nor-1 [Dendryphion nanum]
MSESTITLITGPNRGLGRGLLTAFLARENNTVIAAVRDPSAPLSKELSSIPTGSGSKLITVKIDSAVEGDAKAAVESLTSSGITHLDTVIANAGTGTEIGPVLSATAAAVRDTMETNVIGVLGLFQATEPLLHKSSKPKFFTLSSNLGSLGIMEYAPGPWFTYGITKAALNYLTRKIHFENEWLVSVALSPGWVQTDMGALAAKAVGMEAAPLTVEQSVPGLVSVIDGATRDTTSGTFTSHDGQPVPW